MTEMKQSPSAEAFAKIGSEMNALLASLHPDLQGPVVASMIIGWLGGLPPERREQAVQTLMKTVRATIETLAKEHAARDAP